MTLNNKVAIVNGGGHGLGAGYCRALATEGASVVVADIAENGARDVAGEIGGLAVRVDVSDDASVQHMVTTAMERYGRIDILINNAALYSELRRPPKAFDAIPIDEWIGSWRSMFAASGAAVWRSRQSSDSSTAASSSTSRRARSSLAPQASCTT